MQDELLAADSDDMAIFTALIIIMTGPLASTI